MIMEFRDGQVARETQYFGTRARPHSGTDGLRTLRWSKPDSNSRSRSRRSGFCINEML
jgi:hypothetical protein